eukprot:2568594-Prymnesium_polylepis.1
MSFDQGSKPAGTYHTHLRSIINSTVDCRHSRIVDILAAVRAVLIRGACGYHPDPIEIGFCALVWVRAELPEGVVAAFKAVRRRLQGGIGLLNITVVVRMVGGRILRRLFVALRRSHHRHRRRWRGRRGGRGRVGHNRAWHLWHVDKEPRVALGGG